VRPAAVLERHAALAIRVLLVGALVAGFVVAFHQLQPIVLPLLFALLFTALLSPAVGWLEAHGARRWFAAASVLVVFIALLIGAVIYVTAPVVAQAGDAARGATAVVTLEPCHHTGRTGPCTQALLDAGFERHQILHRLIEVLGRCGDDPRALGAALDTLRHEPPPV